MALARRRLDLPSHDPCSFLLRGAATLLEVK
jgi:hypothetical protein